MGYYDNNNFGERLGCMAAAVVLVFLGLGARELWHWAQHLLR